jgi:hypothetical protein
MFTEEEIDSGMSDDEAVKRLAEAMSGTSGVIDEKLNVHKFLFSVATASDTTKLGYLRDDRDLNEIGVPKYPIRAYKSLALISDKIMNNPYFTEYFNAESEIVTSTSLSRMGKLINLAVLQKREISDVSASGRSSTRAVSSWFKKKAPKATNEVLG